MLWRIGAVDAASRLKRGLGMLVSVGNLPAGQRLVKEVCKMSETPNNGFYLSHRTLSLYCSSMMRANMNLPSAGAGGVLYITLVARKSR